MYSLSEARQGEAQSWLADLSDWYSAIWIGTNDIGPSAFFTDNRLNLSIIDYVDCVYEQLDLVYEAGARNFVLLNLAPLNYAPMYALPQNGGTIDTHYWPLEDLYSTNA